ncbi:uncharacterized protein LOC120537122 [Polypterus senegalus]|uniref:uncharacterized protein LOC120537122 n=1 Tax=Polypterus senegalus TaxID=55291 RepID=UPI001965B3E5|nr:uncharacterized protein LOC120537122 [Polypterus senegalus]
MKGVRAMYRRVRDFRGIRPCYRNDVHEVMRQLDARGLHRRQPGNRKILRCQYSTKGPNHTWHIDGNDKLRFYGIWIHLCIDGYSRSVIWLHAGTSNRNPRLIARYFLDAVETENGCPRLVRADRGCENSLVAIIQMSFRYRHHDSLAGVNSFRYGKSIHNQRAEYFNGYLKKSWICFWQKHFEAMVEAEILELSNPIHIHCVQYCFLPLIERQLYSERIEWNNQRIHKQTLAAGPFGKPDMLYFCPPSGTPNMLCTIDDDLQQQADTMACEKGSTLTVANVAFRQLCSTVFTLPRSMDSYSVDDAMASYLTTANHITTLMASLNLIEPDNFVQAFEIYEKIVNSSHTKYILLL